MDPVDQKSRGKPEREAAEISKALLDAAEAFST
jgi:hypothetical protein